MRKQGKETAVGYPMKKSKIPVKERLKKRSVVKETTGCLILCGYKDSGGYIRTKDGNGKTRLAHRLVWELEHGPIPEGMYICHKCDMRDCINIEHLFLGTHKDNMYDCRMKLRQMHGEKNHRSKLTEKDVITIRELYKNKYKREDIAYVFGITPGNVSHIATGRSWTIVPI